MNTQRSDDQLLNGGVDETAGVEAEPEDPSIIEIERPFNPEKIKVRTVNIVVEQLVSRIRHHEIDLAPEFQRMRGIWSKGRKSRLIESLLLRIPIPVFYVSADNLDNWAVVDGVQRMSTIFDFVTGEFSFAGLEYLDELLGFKYTELPRNMRRRINETQLIVNVIEPGTPGEVMFNIFHRINTGGMTLNGQEIRHALNPGPVRDYLRKLAQGSAFLKATDHSIREERMQDRECVLRFLAFYTNPWEDYAVNDLDGFLVDAMKSINKMPEDKLHKLERKFRRTMKAAADIFDDDAFRKRTYVRHRRKPVNKALFEAWSVGLARCSVRDLQELVKKRIRLRRKFRKLLREDWEFDMAVSTSTGVPQRVKKRFGEIEALIREVV
ncbi:MAG: DUF262 domain-containing protein [Rhodobacteraceae bacterium]|nr:DUF262 domain-containing protein [Paracoccaceae bacterium]